MRALPWWEDRIAGAFASYWIHQHLGNLQPRAPARRRRARRGARGARRLAGPARVRAAGRPRDGGRAVELLPRPRRRAAARHRLARRPGAARRPALHGRRRGVGLDLRAPRRRPRPPRSSPRRCRCCSAQGMHFLEAWSEAVCDGAWGGPAARLGERLRRAADLEHWAAFGESFERLTTRLREVGAGRHGAGPGVDRGAVGRRPPRVPRRGGVPPRGAGRAARSGRRSARRCATRSTGASGGRSGSAPPRPVTRSRARWPGPPASPDPDLRWRMVEGPVFDNQVATLEFDHRAAAMAVERARPTTGGTGAPELVPAFAHRLA